MKSKSKKRILALVLSMVLMLSTGISAMAEGEAANGKTDGTTAEKTEPAAENQEVQEGSGETPDGEKPEELQEVAEAQTQTDGSQESGTEEIISEAADLYQDFQDENGNVITTIHAYVPEGAFQAKADQITMQAKLLDQESDNYIKGMIEEKLPENSYLGGYVLYEVNFMVDGVITEPAKAITLTIEGSGLSVTDLSRTKAFRYDPADPDVDGDKDELVEMGQKADVLTYLAENGIGEDQLSTYEYSELDVQEEIAHQIGFNTWKSTIYGCYTEAYSAEYTFSQEVNGAAVNVTAPEGAFPTAVENVSFAAAAVTEEQDALIQDQLAAKAEGLGQEVKDYEAYDLSFTVNGEEVQPQVPVTVSFENTGLSTEEANGTQNFQLDEEAGAVNDLEGSADDGTAAMTLSQMGTVGYWAYGDAAADEDGSKDDADVDDTVVPGDDTETPAETPTETPDDPEQDQTDAEIEDDTEEDSNLTDDSEDQIQEDGEEDKTEEGDLEDDADEADETDKEDVTEKEDAELAEDAETEKDTTASGEETEENSSKEESKETEEDIEDTEEDQEEKEDDSQDGKGQDVEEEDGQEDDSKDKDANGLTLKEEAEEKDTAKEDAQEKEEVKELTYEDDSVVVTVSAEKDGVIPKGAELSVTPIEKTEITKDMSAEEKAEAEKMNEQYAFTEEKLQEESEAKDETMEGFLAYDICFLVDGEEVEPSGEVQVVLDFKKAAIPEGVSEDTEVTVKHLKEDTDAEDGIVVEDMTEVADIQATEEAEVEKILLTADSFSTFTIQWGSSSSNKITVHYVDAQGTEIQGTTSRKQEVNTGKNVKLSDYAGTISGYTYQGAHVNRHTGTEVYSVKYSRNADTRWTYKTKANGGDNAWNVSGERHVYLVYKVSDELTTVTTIDNESAGITMSMKNYDSAAAGLSDSIGGGYGNGSVKQNLLNSKLQNGYPVTKNGTSLRTLFSNGETVNHLFRKDIYDETGYYEYSSFENYAYLNDNGNFTVYDQIGTPEHGGAYYFKRGNFMPYNRIEAGKYATDNCNLYDEDGNPLDTSHPRYEERLYKTQGTNDFYFGMYMEVNFLQPKGGKAIHTNASTNETTTSDMIYEFNGDDDLWVFIDNVLVLDIGGIHDAHSGYINFATGKVHVQLTKNNSVDTTITELYRNAKVFPDGSTWDEEKVSNYFDGNTFKDYTNHVLKMFYMERGAGASNLHMKFNLQTVPSGAIEVTKELTNTDKEKYANVEFAFQVYAQKITGYDADGNEVYGNDYETLANDPTGESEIQAVYKGTETLIEFKDDVKIGDDSYDDVFYLKPGQTAQFTGLQNNRKYYVVEVGVNAKEYDEIIINGTTIKSYDENEQESSKIENIESGKEAVYERPAIVFQNSCSAYNKKELQITKTMKAGQTTDDTFTFKIWLENTEGNAWAAYQGNYYLTQMVDGERVYYHYDNNNKLVAYTGDEESLVCGTTTDGTISGVPVGYTVAITQLLSGTSFKVEEINLGDEYFDYVKTITAGTCGESENEALEGADGEILLGKNAEITVENRKRVNELKIKKVDSENSTKNLSGAVFKLQKWDEAKEEFVDVFKNDKVWEITTDDTGMVVFSDLENGTYQVVETIAPEGYVLPDNSSFSITLPYEDVTDSTIQVDPNSQLENGSYSVVTKTVTNEKKDWEIIKRSTSDDDLYIGGAKFELRKTDSNITYYGQSQQNTGIVFWYSSPERTEAAKIEQSAIAPGIYQLVETAAPNGYTLSTETWTITVGQNGALVSVQGIEAENKSEENNKTICYFDNTPLYELPSAGGPGIFLYMIGGTLLLIAGSLMIYINRRKGVLEK